MLFGLTLTLLAASGADDESWSRFRGPNGSGVSAGRGLPVEFGPGKDAAWSVDVPFGRSSPVLTADAVFLTGADEERLYVVCLDRESGAVRWERHVERRHSEELYSANDSASPTPVTDGENVYAFFPERGLVSYDRAGKERWQLPLGPFISFYGMAASPILAGDTLVLLCDQQQGSYLLAVDVDTGAVRWRTEREGMIESWATPVLYPADDPEQVIAFGTFFVCGYSLETGAEEWRKEGVGYTPVCSPILDGDQLYVCVPYHAEQPLPGFDALLAGDANEDGKLARAELSGPMVEHFGWADADKDGFIDRAEWQFCVDGMSSKDFGLVAIDLAPLSEGGEVREVWRHTKGLPSIASPLLVEGVIYLVKNGGIFTALDSTTGEVRARERIEGLDAEISASPVAADGKIYIAAHAGQVVVREALADGAILATNDLGGEISATPAIGGRALFIRTRDSLTCFRKPAD